jgi:rhodanese-related sulfurtransferase
MPDHDIAIYDSRSFEEYHNNSIPTAISVPGAELVYRFADLMPSQATTVIVNCGGRTRSIIGAQSLINAAVPNKVVRHHGLASRGLPGRPRRGPEAALGPGSQRARGLA